MTSLNVFVVGICSLQLQDLGRLTKLAQGLGWL